jgi:hypothetical protein
VLIEERDYDFDELREPTNSILQEILTVVVVPSVAVDATDAEELLELLERCRACHTLSHDESMDHLVAGSVAGPSRPIGLTNEANGEASFSVYETNDPAGGDQPFLLIARTVQIITAHTKMV